MGTEGMKASLISREVIADSIELVTRANSFDGLVCIAGCDKNMPAAIMALARLNIPGLMLYGGSIAPGHAPSARRHQQRDHHPLSVFEAIGSHAAGRINDDQLEAVEAAACPGPGACGGQFTANTMAMAGEFLGISPIQLSGVPAMSKEKHAASREAGRMVMELARKQIKPRDITRATPSTTPSPPSPHPAAAPTPCSTSSPSRTSSTFPLSMEDFDQISETHALHLRPLSPAASTPRRIIRKPAARACSPAPPRKSTAR